MDTDHAPLDPAEISRGMAEAGVPWSLLCLDECASTNREALARAAEDPALAESGLAVFAGWQSAGRGRRGARWQSERDADLLFSVALEPPLPAERWSRLTHAAALAVSQALEPDLTPAIKWPNDVYLGQAKAAGILVESEPAAGLAVIGLGLNVNSDPTDLGDEVAAPATSLRAQLGSPADRSATAVALLAALHRAVELASSDFPKVLEEVSRRSLVLGHAVTLMLPDGAPLAGVASGFGAEGELCLDLSDGSRREVASAHQLRLA